MITEFKYKNRLYLVSDDGHIYRKSGKEVEYQNEHGYLRVPWATYVHRMIAMVYIPNPENKSQVDHIDGDPTNNRVSNLRGVTASENCQNPISKQRRSEANMGERNPMYGRTLDNSPYAKQVKCVETGVIYPCVKTATQITGVNHIADVARGVRKIAGGFHWEYV